MASETIAAALPVAVDMRIFILSRALSKTTLCTIAYGNLSILSSIANLPFSREQQTRTAKWKGQLGKYLEHSEVGVRNDSFSVCL